MGDPIRVDAELADRAPRTRVVGGVRGVLEEELRQTARCIALDRGQ